MKREIFGDILIKKNLINFKELAKALAIQKRQGGKLGEILLRQGVITKNDFEKVVSELTGSTPFKEFNKEVNKELILNFPNKFLEKYKGVPIYEEEDFIHFLTYDPFDLNALDEVKFNFGKNLKIYFLDENSFNHFLKKFDLFKESNSNIEVQEMFDKMLSCAIEKKASDIHIESHGEKTVVRFRINGVLEDRPIRIPKELFSNFVNYLKILSNLDITKQRIPQDGQFLYFNGNKKIPVRLSTIPTQYGEKVVLHLLYRSSNLVKLESLNMNEEVLNFFKLSINQLNGLVLVTGPTGSGKTTTLYAALEHLNTPEKNICTLEDPIEIRLPGIIQSQIDEKSNFTFAKGKKFIKTGSRYNNGWRDKG